MRADFLLRLHAQEEFPSNQSINQSIRGLGHASSTDGGESFSPPALVPGLGGDRASGFNGSQQGLLAAKLATSTNGRLAMANSLFIPGDTSQIRFVSRESHD
jgi:hypothetical protein